MGGYHTELTGDCFVQDVDLLEQNYDKINFKHIYGIYYMYLEGNKIRIKLNKKRANVIDYVNDLKKIVKVFEEYGLELSGKLNLSLPDYDDENYHTNSYKSYHGNKFDMFYEYVEIDKNKIFLYLYKTLLSKVKV